MAEVDGNVFYGEISKGAARSWCAPTTARSASTPSPRACTSTCRRRRRARGRRLHRRPKDPHKILEILGSASCRSTCWTASRRYRLQGVNINDKHIETIIRQMMRWIKVEDPGHRVHRGRAGGPLPLHRGERARAGGGRGSGPGPSSAPGHHQGLALHGLLHLRGLLPGDHARAHRGLHLGEGGSPARAQGERDHGPSHPGGTGNGHLPRDRDHPRRSASHGGADGEEQPPAEWTSTPIASPR